MAGKSNSLGNASTNASTGAASAAYDTAFMSYRGIENLFGNCWNWTDGANINNNQLYVSTDTSVFADDTAVGYSKLTTLPNSSGWQSTVQPLDAAILPATVGATDSATGLTDYCWQNPGWCVLLSGGGADNGGSAGLACFNASDDSGLLDRGLGSRLAR